MDHYWPSLIPGTHAAIPSHAELWPTTTWTACSYRARPRLQLDRAEEARCPGQPIVGVTHEGADPGTKSLGSPELWSTGGPTSSALAQLGLAVAAGAMADGICRGGGRRRTRLGRHRGGFVGAGSRGAAAAGIGRRNSHPVGIRRFPLRPIGTNLRWCQHRLNSCINQSRGTPYKSSIFSGLGCYCFQD